MPVVLSKEAELKAEVAALKSDKSGAEQKANSLSLQLGHAHGEIAKLKEVAAAKEDLDKKAAALEAELAHVKAQLSSATAHAAKAAEVLGVVKALKSLLANV